MIEEMAELVNEHMALRRAWVQAQKLAMKLTVPCGLTPARYEVLQALEDPAEHIDTQSALQKKLGVKGPSMSKLVGELVKRGLVVRVRDADDRRQVRLAATDEGRRRYLTAKARFESADVGATCGLILAAMSGLPIGGGPRVEARSSPVVHRPLFAARHAVPTLS
jgi:DNA-binding MarR family transcriptional regulator